ncbi:type II secretion system protein N [Achromobacter xylosoxidans]|uniref:type II secretion system protein N n=1 Tax=Alcaligenes xylosoxydans xylosoxydans TaxID=85698 RepID=UPI001F13FDE0|nr:type II secretion system protein N [Achromobacter xylosoxidans]MDZ5615848.1 type II secretion system protein N [Achromobacter xylosoxidans]MDZ5628810.1 type II secretion system protein N [Achromobacter xylosoxidans]MDZ5686443.1 type II secretion system protein N [Achromobacter xylosoxidans]
MRLPRLPKRAGLALACAASALVFGGAVLPARWLLALQPDDAPLVLADAAGTLWNGAAWIALGPPGARRMLPQPLHWQWRWSSLTLELSHPWLQGPLRAGLGWDGVAVSAQSLRLPATVLPALGAPWNTLAPEGALEISWQALRLGAALPQAPLAELRWRDAATALSPVAPVGTYVLRVRGDGRAGATLALSTDSGPLAVTGQGSLDARGVRFQGQATFAAGATEAERGALDGLMSALGRRSDDTVVFGTGK